MLHQTVGVAGVFMQHIVVMAVPAGVPWEIGWRVAGGVGAGSGLSTVAAGGPIIQIDLGPGTIEGIEVINIGYGRTMAGKTEHLSVSIIAPLWIDAGMTDGAGAFFGHRIVAATILKDHILDLINMVSRVDMAILVHRPDRCLPLDVTNDTGAIIGFNCEKVAIFTGELGLQVADVGVGPIGSRPGIFVHRRGVDPFLAERPSGYYRLAIRTVMTGAAIALMAVTGIAMRDIGGPVQVGDHRIDGGAITVAVEIIAVLSVAVVARIGPTGNLPLGIDDHIDLLVDMLTARLDRAGHTGRSKMTIFAGVFPDPLGAGQNIMGTRGHFVTVDHQVRIGINQVTMTVEASGRGGIGPGWTDGVCIDVNSVVVQHK